MMQSGRKADLEPIDAKQEYAHTRTQGGSAAPPIFDARRNAELLDNSPGHKLHFSNEADLERWEVGQLGDACDVESTWARAARDWTS